jgi:hypothetical protein
MYFNKYFKYVYYTGLFFKCKNTNVCGFDLNQLFKMNDIIMLQVGCNLIIVTIMFIYVRFNYYWFLSCLQSAASIYG